MLKLRFIRTGRKHDPNFRLVAVDSRRAPRSGSYLENLGFYSPCQNSSDIDKERVSYWLSKGARASATVHNLLVKSGIIKAKKMNVVALSKLSAKQQGQKNESEKSPESGAEASARKAENKKEKGEAVKEEIPEIETETAEDSKKEGDKQEDESGKKEETA